MDDETILARGGSEEDIKKYAEQNGVDNLDKDLREILIPCQLVKDLEDQVVNQIGDQLSLARSEARREAMQEILTEVLPGEKPETSQMHTSDIRMMSSTQVWMEQNKGFNEAVTTIKSKIAALKLNEKKKHLKY